MSDIAVERYKTGVKRIVDVWRPKVDGPARKLAKLDDEIADLQAKKPPGDDDKKRLGEAKKAYLALRQQIESANSELRTDLMLFEMPAKTAANEKELLTLPPFIEQIIKAKGVPLGKGVSIRPDIKFDFKAMKLKEAGLTITWRF